MKRLSNVRNLLDRKRLYPLNEAIRLVKESATAKFDETIEIAVNLNLDPRHADQQLRSSVILPHGNGKTLRIAVFARGDKADLAKKAGADIVGAEDLMEKVLSGEINFDRCIALPEMMGIVGRLGKVLGPRNLMPNPKLGTVTPDIITAIKAAKSGDVQYRVEKSGIVHAGIGRASFSDQAIYDNVCAFMKSVHAARPSGAKGYYVKKVFIASTMGIGVAIDMALVTK